MPTRPQPMMITRTAGTLARGDEGCVVRCLAVGGARAAEEERDDGDVDVLVSTERLCDAPTGPVMEEPLGCTRVVASWDDHRDLRARAHEVHDVPLDRPGNVAVPALDQV